MRRVRLQRFGRDAPGGGGRRAGDGHLRPDRRARDRADRATHDVLVHPGVLPSLHAARLPDRSPLHEGHQRRRRSPRASGAPREGANEAGRLPRPRRHAHRGVRLPRSPRPAGVLSRSASTRCGCSIAPGSRSSSSPTSRASRRGLVRESFVAEAHAHISAALTRRRRARSTAFYYCPHHPDASVPAVPRSACDCRKPAAGHAAAAAREHGLDLARSFVVGDRWDDVGRGARGRRARRAGADRLWPRGRSGAAPGTAPDLIADNLVGRGVDPAHSLDGIDARTGRADRRTPAGTDRRVRRHSASRSSATSSPTSSSTAQIARVSREAPVLILNYDSTEIVPGGAGNAANERRRAGRRAVGDRRGRRATRPGERLVAALGIGASTARGVGAAARLPDADQDAHPRRRRALGQAAGGADRSRRVARRCRRRTAARSRRSWCWAAARCDALLVSDYGTGLVTPAAVRDGDSALRRAAAAARRCWSTRATRCCGSAA